MGHQYIIVLVHYCFIPAYLFLFILFDDHIAKNGVVFYPSEGERITRGLEYVAISRPTALADLFLMSGLKMQHFSAALETPLSYKFIGNFYSAMRRGIYSGASEIGASAVNTGRRLRSKRNHAAGGEMDLHIFPFNRLTVVI